MRLRWEEDISVQILQCHEPLETPSYVHSGISNISPNSVKCLSVRVLLPQTCDVGHCRVKVCGPHGMANSLRLIFNRCMLLSISWRHHAFSIGHISLSANFKELFRHIKVQFLSSYLVKFNQSQFHFLMTRCLADGFTVVVIWVSLKNTLFTCWAFFSATLSSLSLPVAK